MHSSSFTQSTSHSRSLTITVHGSNRVVEHQTRRPGESDPMAPITPRSQALHALKSCGNLDIGGLASKMRNPAGSWTDITHGLSPSSSAVQANHNLNSKDLGLKSTCKPFIGNPSVANCLAAAGGFHQTGPLEIKPTDDRMIKIVWNCATVIGF